MKRQKKTHHNDINYNFERDGYFIILHKILKKIAGNYSLKFTFVDL